MGRINAQAEETVFYLPSSNKAFAGRAMMNLSKVPVLNVRYDKFFCADGSESTDDCPGLSMGIKYVASDTSNIDSAGKSRYVYCMEVHKSTPEEDVQMSYSGWADKKITYALYHGAGFFEEPCRNPNYRSGDWQIDYFVTQISIHILNGEFTLSAFWDSLSRESAATQDEKDLVYSLVEKMVNDAKKSSNYSGFTSEGWMDLSQGKFSVSGYEDSWGMEDGTYYSDGTFKGNLESLHGYDYKAEITRYAIDVPDGVSVERLGQQIYADFRVKISEDQFERWQLTGYTIPVNIKVSVPKYWGAKIYSPKSDDKYQDICMLAWTSEGGTVTFSDSAELHIEQKCFPRNLVIQKKILASEVNWDHGNPTFFFEISGVDVEGNSHSYHTFLEFKRENVVSQKGEHYVLECLIEKIPSGNYHIQEENNVMRYVLTDAGALSDNVTVEKKMIGTVNGVAKIEADITADLTLEDAKVFFTNAKVMHHKYSDNAVVRNHFVVPD